MLVCQTADPFRLQVEVYTYSGRGIAVGPYAIDVLQEGGHHALPVDIKRLVVRKPARLIIMYKINVFAAVLIFDVLEDPRIVGHGHGDASASAIFG